MRERHPTHAIFGVMVHVTVFIALKCLNLPHLDFSGQLAYFLV